MLETVLIRTFQWLTAAFGNESWTVTYWSIDTYVENRKFCNNSLCQRPELATQTELVYTKTYFVVNDIKLRTVLSIELCAFVWRFGGPDPLDYISMYVNSGDPDRDIPAHWHYVSFGLSDLHGDGRVHEYVKTSTDLSSFRAVLRYD